MKKIQILFLYVVGLLTILSILGISDLITLTGNSWNGIGLTAFGIGIVYIFFGEQKSHILFAGAFSFLLGNFLFIIDSFELIKGKQIILPTLLLITGLSFLFLYIENSERRKYLFSALILILFGLISVLYFGSLNILLIFYYTFEIIKIYWSLAIIILLVIYIFNRIHKS